FEWYLKNHLGSTMLVYGTQGSSNTDIADLGEVKKAYDYRSFGEQIDLIADAGDKVTENFTGKEKDDETELNYFGARYLDPMLGMWISVDPKRQFASPYLYVGNGMNPLNATDPDGNIIKMYSRNSESYNIAANDALKEIENSGPEGKAFIAKLRSSDQEIIIKQSSKRNHTEAHGRNAVVLWDMNAVMGGENAEGSRRRSTSVGLAHELGHSEDIIDGKFTKDERYNKDGIPIKEENAIKRENQIREDLGEPLREFY
ncbi:RHS repeat-associated core domain-containing protein, partial [Fibrobacter sp. UWH9]|uniref:RHS repeat-associated core domain-containing protein n=1 Tax=Fibrobacter sp. UWH9 TaxID=1896213 RepID=UPI0009206D53